MKRKTARQRARWFAEIERQIAIRSARIDVLAARIAAFAARADARKRLRNRRYVCETCGREYRPTRTDQRFCRHACRQRAYRRRHGLRTYPVD